MTPDSSELQAAALAWIEGDPDPETRAELTQLLEAGDTKQLAERMQPLGFGTAGLRGAVGAGSGRMNLAVVLRTAYAIARYLADLTQAYEPAQRRPIVLGFDARPTSRSLAEASAGVLLAAGHRVVAFAEPSATPLAAFVGRELQAAATIVVTASHNPRQDNGYKVYGADAIQITSPVDQLIAAYIATAPPANVIPRRTLSFAQPAPDGLTLVDEPLLARYFEALSRALPAGSSGRELRIVHSALHGVGSAPMLRSLADAGFARVSVVARQAEPDGSFPTTPFPNPEEPGTLDLALEEAERASADLLLVSDPDADRLAAAARLDARLCVLDGNQLGALLADYALSRHAVAAQALVLSSVVSSPLVELLAQTRGAHHERTHTGFKWLWSAALSLERADRGSFCFAYEEALGYSVFAGVRDKDGIAAGRALSELAALQRQRGATLFDRLHELYREHGLWASAASNVTLSGAGAAEQISKTLDQLSTRPAFELEGDAVTGCVDYRKYADARPPWRGSAQLLELVLASGARVLVRPSGTEPKLKLYAHVRRDASARSELAAQLAAARRSAAALLQGLQRALKL